jgi:hemoglobin-like flavoprotein
LETEEGDISAGALTRQSKSKRNTLALCHDAKQLASRFDSDEEGEWNTMRLLPIAQIEIIQETFNQISDRADLVANDFYERLFVLEPSLRPLFPQVMHNQRQKLITVISSAVIGLSQPDALDPVLRSLGERHVHYGVSVESYPLVGQALIGALAHALGPRFTPEVEAAWVSVYEAIAEVMIDAATALQPSK